MGVDWALLATLAGVAMAIGASLHAALTKRDVRAAAGWAAISWLAPFIGPTAYYALGINRIQRRAVRLRQRRADGPSADAVPSHEPSQAALEDVAPHLASLRALVDGVARQPLTSGNTIDVLSTGDQAYRAMIKAIDHAEHCVVMASYIVDADRAGRRFVDALVRAHQRGVAVRFLIDGVGALYTRPPITRELAAAGVPTAHFLPPRLVPWRVPYANMRNHRKILVVDGCVGFTGAMNVRQSFLSDDQGRPGERDTHFRLAGPVVTHLAEAFAQDWAFATGEILDDPKWLPDIEPTAGKAFARGITSGPDRPLEANHTVIHGALTVAKDRVVILTPYFIPDRTLVAALGIAARRGVSVDIVLPESSNLRLVDWATRAQLAQVLEPGCRVWFSPPPFDHSKLLVVDDAWALIGSSNWDARSLRLNFEFDVEVYDPDLVVALNGYADSLIARSRREYLDDVTGRSFPVRVRDAAVWLFAPYL